MTLDDAIAQAQRWAEHDPDPETRSELRALVASRSAELLERFAGPLEFGTAGLRGILGGGESRMNRAVVRRATSGLGRYLLESGLTRPGEAPVVVGYDGRRLSREFAHETAAVLCAQGIVVHLSDELCPTPMVAYAVRQLGAAAGIMVTASHNPPVYNGYKVYAGNGAQIIPPVDQHIAAAIARSAPADEISVADHAEARAKGLLRGFGAALERRYLDEALALVASRSGNRTLPIAYTPMHGVGHKLARQLFTEAGFTSLHTVAEQAEPDGAFPTVTFPNPEEPGALELAFALARKVDAPLVIANDPDADRLAVAVRTPAGSYQQLTGNQVGCLLGHHLMTCDPAATKQGLVVTTVVSSPLLGVMARELGLAYAETLTGFKWIANRGMQLEQERALRFLYGYEEALGYTIGTAVRDKDGISAALVLGVLAAELAAEGKTLLDRLDEIALRFGLFESTQRSVVLPGRDGSERMSALMATLRASPPDELAGAKVESVTDLQTGERRRRGEPKPTRVELPRSNVLVLELEGGHRVVARPSGTEPKIKFYVDVREPVADLGDVGPARQRATERLRALEAALLQSAGL